jgi:hypothetical protein
MKKIVLLLPAIALGLVAAAQQPDSLDEKQPVQLNEVIVTASQLEEDAPVTLHTIRRQEITRFLSAKTYPELMRNIGGVYATSESGSYGDAKINIRGFKQENFTVMLNGIPLSGFRSGSMFWNNWLGLANATYRVQVQKGIGGSMLAANSMGGTINIVTRPGEQEAGGALSFDMTDYGLYRTNISLSTGLMDNGWALSFAGSRSWGEGYVDATGVNSWAYFLNASKVIDRRHTLLFTVLGAPERHGQRSQKLSQEEVDKYGPAYNKNWGVYNGKINNISENFYHKPFLAANHFFRISDRLLLANTLYFSLGTGGGKWTESTGRRIISYLNDGGQIDWEAVIADNVNHRDTIAGTTLGGYAKNIQSDYLAGHVWAGLKSTVDAQLGRHWKWSSGLHYQFFYSWQRERITDLLGGQFWYEDYAHNSLAGTAGRNPVKKEGDWIRLNNGDQDHHLSAYSQIDYTAGRLQAFLGGMLMVNLYQHWDKYNYPTDPYSKPVAGTGGNIKAGASVKITPRQQVYLNGGFYSRVPYNNVYFSAGTKDITENVRNEKNYIAEAGYKFSSQNIHLTINGYYNYWQNKALMSDPYKPVDDEQVCYMITGLDAQHAGLEISYDQWVSSWMSLSAFASVGNWMWKNDVNATIYDPYTSLPADTLRVFTNGLYVGDAPQTQLGMTLTFTLLGTLEIRAEGRYNDRMYANFDPAKRQDSNDRRQSYRIPSSFVADLHLNYPFSIAGTHAQLYFSCNNVFDALYIERGDDGKDHDLASFRGFWSIGRHIQAGLRIRF